MKKFLCMLTVVLLLVGMIPMSAFATNEAPDGFGQIVFDLDEGTAVVNEDFEPLEYDLYTFEGVDGFWYPIGETLTFIIETDEYYQLMYEAWSNEDGSGMDYDDNGFCIGVVAEGVNTISTFTDKPGAIEGTSSDITVTVPALDAEDYEGLTAITEELTGTELTKVEDVFENAYGSVVEMKAFDIHLEDADGDVVNIDSKKLVRMAFPDEWSEYDMDDYFVNVYHVDTETGIVTDMGAGNDYGENVAIFETNHFSYFVMALEDYMDYERISGKNRYITSIMASEVLLELQDEVYYDYMIVASGENYPDALTGSYLSAVTGAPIVLISEKQEDLIFEYIEYSLDSDGLVFLLGGDAAVSEKFEKRLDDADIANVRLKGKSRYDTNLEILKQTGVTDEPLLVCSGSGYADSLSASALGLPIMLVGNSLTAAQKEYLATIDSDTVYIIGGEAAVSAGVEEEFDEMGYDVERIKGKNRYATSTAVARKFFPASQFMVLAYAKNFPDGLSGGPIALWLGAPIILADNTGYTEAQSYVEDAGVKLMVAMGGNGCYSDETLDKILFGAVQE